MLEEKTLHVEQVVNIVSELIKRPSFNPGGDEYEVAQYIKQFMEELQIPVQLVPISDRRFNVIARLPGAGNAAPLMFTGHMDVVPVNDTEQKKWHTDPFVPEQKDGQLFGRGSADMKGGLGAAMAAMQAIRQQGLTPPGDIILVGTVDEEATMQGAKAIIKTDLLKDVHHLVICEPSDMQLMCCCRGRTWADITLLGESGHASIEGNGNNAIVQATKLIQALPQEKIPFTPHPLFGNAFWQATVIHGGVEPAMVPDNCVVTVDARLVPGQKCTNIWSQMEQVLAKLHQQDPRFVAEMKIIEQRDPWETPLEHALVHLAQDCYHTLHLPIKYGGASYTTDGSVFMHLGMDMIIIGPGDIALAHRQNESVPILQLEQAAQLYYAMMMQNNL